MTHADHIAKAIEHLRQALADWRADPDDQPAEAARWGDLFDVSQDLEKVARSAGVTVAPNRFE